MTSGSWDTAQVRLFAKQIADSKEGRAWWAFPSSIRAAIISHHVMMVMLSLRERAIEVDDVRELRLAITNRLADHHNMTIEEGY